MKALFIGLGSIGGRHLKNLAALCAERAFPLEVTALRSSDRALPEDVTALVHRQLPQLPAGETFDLAFITNPTHLHAEALRSLQGRVGCYFIEKPIFEKAGYALQDLGLGEGQKAYVAAPMRWCGVYLALKEALKKAPVYAVRAICSSYLPDWRPAADYRTVYSAHAEMGGGVTLDLIHEWDYLVDLFGFPLETSNLRGTYSHLEINSDDLSVYIARYPGFLCEVHLDYFGREYRRTLEVFSREGCFTADFGKGTLTLPGGETQDCAEPANRRYEREMAYFLDYAMGQNGESANSPAKAEKVLRLVTSPHWSGC